MKEKMVYTLRIIVSFALLTPALSFSQDDLWTQKAELTYSRSWASANYTNGKIYLIGGLPNSTAVEEYTIETDSWQTKSSMPTPRAFVGNGVVNGKIYIIGGAVVNTNIQSVVEKYDPATDEWTAADNMNEPWFGMASCVYNNKIYIFGGKGGSGPGPGEKKVAMYDPAAGDWIYNLADMPTARWLPECVLVDSLIYVVGGWYHSQTVNGAASAVEAYNPETDSWTRKASLPQRRAAGAVAALNGKIYYFGGSPNGPPQKDIYVYDPTLDQWTILPDMPFVWGVMASCVADDLAYLMAGSKVSYPFPDNFHGLYSYNPSNTTTHIDRNEMGNNYPTKLILNQNYPNPFNPRTVINYQIAKTSAVELSIFNHLGQRVETLVSENQQSGKYKVRWDASGFASGIYYFKITAGDYQQVKKMILLR